jgi:hypothetical protein
LACAAAPAVAQCELQKVIASDGAPYDEFGRTAAMSGNVAVVGAHNHGNSPPYFNNGHGAAYVFRFDGSNWVKEQQLLAPDAARTDYFGWSVAIDGDVAVIGSVYDDDLGSTSGSVYVFRFDGSAWVLEQKLLADDGEEDDRFGDAVDIDGDAILVGAPEPFTDRPGSAYVFRFDGSEWVQEQKLLASDGEAEDLLGRSVAIDGGVAVIGADGDDDLGWYAGAAYVFRLDASTWVEEQKLLADDGQTIDHFGISVGVSGDTVFVGAPFDLCCGSVYVFRFNQSDWDQVQKLGGAGGLTGDHFGEDVSLDGHTALIGARFDDDVGLQAGSVHVFRFGGASWIEEQELHASDGVIGDDFGGSVAFSGDNAVIGARLEDTSGYESGSAYMFVGLSGDDCNGNGLADTCDILAGTSADCQPNGVPDECDIADGTSEDANENGIPDECEVFPGDVNGDGDVDLNDLALLLAAYGTCAGDSDFDPRADFDDSGCVDLTDLATLLAHYGYAP